MPSFSRQVKNELVRYPYKKRCCALAELQAFLQMSGRLTINKKAVSITLPDTERLRSTAYFFPF